MNQPVDNELSNLTDLPGLAANAPKWLNDAFDVPREEGVVQAIDVDIHYFRWGNPDKPPILMLHGFLSHARCFAFIAPFLADDYHIIAYDLSGMGDSGTRENYFDQMRVDELIAVAEQTGLFEHQQAPTIIAHSYGARIGLEAVSNHPGKFAGLIVCDLMIVRPEVIAANRGFFVRPGTKNSNKPKQIYPDFETARTRFVLAPKQKVEQTLLLEYMAYHSLKQVEGGWTWKFDPSVFNVDDENNAKWGKTGQQLVSASGKKAVVYGAESALFNADSAEYVRELGGTDFPMIGIPNARHHLMLDQPIAFVSVLRGLLATWANN